MRRLFQVRLFSEACAAPSPMVSLGIQPSSRSLVLRTHVHPFSVLILRISSPGTTSNSLAL